MQRGIRKAKTPKQVAAEKRTNRGLATAVAQIIGIGLVAGTALVLGTDKVLKKLTGKEKEEKEK